jgi:hypothetical protein
MFQSLESIRDLLDTDIRHLIRVIHIHTLQRTTVGSQCEQGCVAQLMRRKNTQPGCRSTHKMRRHTLAICILDPLMCMSVRLTFEHCARLMAMMCRQPRANSSTPASVSAGNQLKFN